MSHLGNSLLEDTPVRAGSPTLNRMVQSLANALSAINVVVLIAMFAVVFASVFARYVLNNAFSWSEEFAIWAFTWLIFIGTILGIRDKRHIAIDILLEMLPTRSRSAAEFVRDILVALVVFILTFSGYDLANMVGGVSTILQWPNALRYGIIPAAGFVGLFFLLFDQTEKSGLIRSAFVLVAGGAFYLVIRSPELSPFQTVSPSLIMMLSFLAAMAIGVPVAFAMLLGVFFTTWSADLLPAPAIIQNMVAGSSKFILLAIPFFLTTGYLLNLGGLTSRLIDFASSIFGHFRGGLAQVNVFNSVLIGGISGSSSADAASDSKMLVPEMIKRGYSPQFSCAITAISSILPNILPPAIAMLVYASVSNVSIAKLFMAGIVPGLLVAVALMAMVNIISRKRGYQSATERAPFSTVMRTFVRALPVMIIAVIVLGCIRLGITTATEAGVMAVVWAFVIGKFIFREFTWKMAYEALKDCSTDAAMIGFLIACSVPFAWVLVAEGVPQTLIGWAQAGDHGQFVLLLLMNLILFAMGMFLDLTPAMLITAPLFLPLMTQVGIDPVQLGIIMIINLQLGGVTPPVGILVFISAQITRIAPYPIFREVIPFIVAVLAVLALVCAFPVLTLGLWNLLG
jgi:tripartite ATP-independent transporter DctM subunit